MIGFQQKKNMKPYFRKCEEFDANSTPFSKIDLNTFTRQTFQCK